MKKFAVNKNEVDATIKDLTKQMCKINLFVTSKQNRTKSRTRFGLSLDKQDG